MVIYLSSARFSRVSCPFYIIDIERLKSYKLCSLCRQIVCRIVICKVGNLLQSVISYVSAKWLHLTAFL